MSRLTAAAVVFILSALVPFFVRWLRARRWGFAVNVYVDRDDPRPKEICGYLAEIARAAWTSVQSGCAWCSTPDAAAGARLRLTLKRTAGCAWMLTAGVPRRWICALAGLWIILCLLTCAVQSCTSILLTQTASAL